MRKPVSKQRLNNLKTLNTDGTILDLVEHIEQLQEDKEKIINQFIETKEYYRGRLATEDKRYEEQSATTEQLQGLIRNATIESVRDSDLPLLKEIQDSAPPEEEKPYEQRSAKEAWLTTAPPKEDAADAAIRVFKEHYPTPKEES